MYSSTQRDYSELFIILFPNKNQFNKKCNQARALPSACKLRRLSEFFRLLEWKDGKVDSLRTLSAVLQKYYKSYWVLPWLPISLKFSQAINRIGTYSSQETPRSLAFCSWGASPPCLLFCRTVSQSPNKFYLFSFACLVAISLGRVCTVFLLFQTIFVLFRIWRILQRNSLGVSPCLAQG